MARRRQVAAWVAAGVGVVLFLLLAVVLYFTQTDRGRERIRAVAIDRLDAITDGSVAIDRIEGNLLRGFRLLDVSIVDAEGRPFLRADTVATRFSLVSLLRQRIVLSDLHLARPDIVLDRPPGEAWNYVRIFRIEPDTLPAERSPGWGDWIALDDVTMRDGRLTVRTAWRPPDDVTGPERERVIRDALAGEARDNIVEVPGGYQTVMEFRDLTAEFARILPAHPDSAGIPIEVTSLRGLVQPFQPPAAVIEDLEGKFRLEDDTLRFTRVQAVLPNSRIAAQGTYALASGDLLLQARAEPVAFEDVRWLYPALPDEGGGSLVLRLDMGKVVTRVVAREMDVRVGDAILAGRLDLTTGDTLRLGETDLRFSRVPTDLVRRFIPAFELPEPGVFTGRLALEGLTAALRVDGDVVFDPAAGQASRIIAAGEVGMDGPTRFRDMRLRFEPLQASLVRAFVPDLPRDGTLRGTLRLDGMPSAVLRVAGTVVHQSGATGTSRLGLDGGLDLRSGLRFDGLDVRMDPLTLPLVRAFAPGLPMEGTLAGTARLDGAPAGRLAVRADVVHTDGGSRSRVAGTADIATGPGGRATVDARLDPLALAAVGRFAPGAGLQGSVSGRVRASGRLDALQIDADLDVAGGGALTATGLLDVAGGPPGYDIAFRTSAFDLAAVTWRAPVATSLTGAIHAAGRGVDPATMSAVAAADMVDSGIDDVGADEIRLRVAIDDGIAAIDSSVIRLGSAEAVLDGRIGLVEPRHGDLAYLIAVDSLQEFAHWVAGDGVAARAAPTDTAAVPLAVDAAAPVPADTAAVPAAAVDAPLAGRLRAAGTLRGSLQNLSVDGRMDVGDFAFRGVRAGSGGADFAVAALGTDTPDVRIDGAFDDFAAAGMEFEHVTVEGEYRGTRYGEGRIAVAARQDDDTDYRADAEFLLSLERNELHLADAAFRFDTVTWQTARPGTIRWGGPGIDVESIELIGSHGGRVLADGRLPVEGAGDLRVAGEDVEFAQVMSLLQQEGATAGRLDFDIRLAGTLENPVMEGTATLTDATVSGEDAPDVRATFSYAGREVTGSAELTEDGRLLAVADARLPIDLRLAGDVSRRMLPGEISVDVRADSLPLDAFPVITDQVEDVRGIVAGDITVRGTFDAPILGGVVNLDLGSLRVVPLDVRFTDVTGTLSLDGRTLTVDSIAGSSGGPIRVTGQIDLASLTEPVFDLEVEATNALFIDTDDIRLRADADIDVTGPVGALVVSGDAHAMSGMWRIPELAEMGSSRVVNLDEPETFARIDTTFVAEREALVSRPRVLRNLRVDVGLTIDRDVWLRSSEANVEIYTPPEVGPVRLRMNGADNFAMDGTINTDRGEYEFMSRRFVLTRGAVIFTGEPELNPILQIAAEHEVRMPGREAFQIRVVLSGTLRDLTIALESSAQPPIAQTDLLAYLAFGRDASSLLYQQGSALSGEGGSAGALVGNVAGLATQQLAAVAVESAVKEVEAGAMRDLGLDVFRITPADIPSELFTGRYSDILQGTEIEAGRYISPRLFVAAQARTGLNRPGLRAEYWTPSGFQWRASWQPRFLPMEPTLTDDEPRRGGVFGAFLFREWRF
ncbi:MAG TPA: translocation/assembly module TamB domain-containing protein [Longimicrobiales bacterium]|nr:translocation/assembly module TamB domain-containing protein [Longimicrobiales bacterium]